MRDFLHSLDIGGKALVLPQMTDFGDSQWETSPFLRSGWEMGWEEGGRGRRRGVRGNWDWWVK